MLRLCVHLDSSLSRLFQSLVIINVHASDSPKIFEEYEMFIHIRVMGAQDVICAGDPIVFVLHGGQRRPEGYLWTAMLVRQILKGSSK